MSLENFHSDIKEEIKEQKVTDKTEKQNNTGVEKVEKQPDAEQFQTIMSQVEQLQYGYKSDIGSIGTMNYFGERVIVLRMNNEDKKPSSVVLKKEGDNILAYVVSHDESKDGSYKRVPTDTEKTLQIVNEYIKEGTEFMRKESDKIQKNEEKQIQEEIDNDLDEKLKGI